MQFSLWPSNSNTPAELLEQARTAEGAGRYGVWLADHYMPNTGDATPARGDTYECWALLPALAAVTERIRIPARHAGEWNTWGTPEQAAVHRAALLETCHEVGRDPATVRTSVNALVDLDGNTAPPGPASLFGSAQRLIDQFGQYAEFGFDEFVLPYWNLGTDPSERADKLARIKTEVLDQVTVALGLLLLLCWRGQRLPVVPAPAHGVAHRAQEGQNEADNQDDDADRPDDRDLRDEADD